jgi:TRAP-type uncharacterized transport system fused permease subunit
MMNGTLLEIIWVFITATIGVTAMSMGFQGYYFDLLRPCERLIVLAGGFGMVIPGPITDLIGIAILALMLVLKRRSAGKKKAAAPA